MLDLTSLRKRLPKQLAHMSDEQLEVCLRDMYALAHLAIDRLKAGTRLPNRQRANEVSPKHC